MSFVVEMEDRLVHVQPMGMQTPEGLEIVSLRPLGRQRQDGTRRKLKQFAAGIICTDGTVLRRGRWM